MSQDTSRMITLVDAPVDAPQPLAAWLARDTAADAAERRSRPSVVALAPDDDVNQLAGHLSGLDTIMLEFPQFTDGRAYSQARLLRSRLGFHGTLLATGDVLVDQLPLMWRCGFNEAVLAPGKSPEDARHFFSIVSVRYQGDARDPHPAFAQGLTEDTPAPALAKGSA